MNPVLLWLRQLSALHLALALSLALHAALLTVRLADPAGFERIFQNIPLEVILVNAHSDEAPEHATAIAQVTLAGGGDAAQGRATSPLPSARLQRSGDTLEEDERQTEALRQQQHQLLVQVRQQLAQMPPPEIQADNPSHAALERENRRQALVQILAEIERRINAENARPRKRTISPATREAVYAIYYDALRRKIEDHGTRNFPESAGRRLYGDLTLSISVDHSGSVLHTEVLQPSGIPLLDRQAQAIVRSLNFGPFSAAMRRQADQIVVVSRFRFTREEALQTQIFNPAKN